MELACTYDLVERYNQTLEQEVEQRTVELANAVHEAEELPGSVRIQDQEVLAVGPRRQYR